MVVLKSSHIRPIRMDTIPTLNTKERLNILSTTNQPILRPSQPIMNQLTLKHTLNPPTPRLTPNQPTLKPTLNQPTPKPIPNQLTRKLTLSQPTHKLILNKPILKSIPYQLTIKLKRDKGIKTVPLSQLDTELQSQSIECIKFSRG